MPIYIVSILAASYVANMAGFVLSLTGVNSLPLPWGNLDTPTVN